MRKMILLAAMLAMMLVAAAPAFAQDATADDGGVAIGGDVGNTQYEDSFNTLFFGNQAQFVVYDVTQVQSGTATAVADDGSAAAASAEQSLDISTSQSLWIYF